ncbi:MAG: hypothetical protein KDK70_27355 [Myxococcales bacterium]|nr:hypothetical protein [Myxococcales bacterium]
MPEQAPAPSPSETSGASEADDELIIIDGDAADDPAEEPTPAAAASSVARPKPDKPKHETAPCAKARQDAAAGPKSRSWKKVLELTSKRSCWSSAQQDERIHLEVWALLELGRFDDCVEAGRRAKSAPTKALVSTCTKQLKP